MARPATASGISISITATGGGAAVAGQGVTDHGDVFTFTASSDVSGPRGSVTFTIHRIGLTVRGPVTCFTVHGSAATIGIRITSASNPGVVGNGFWLAIQNNLTLNGLSNVQMSTRLGTTNPRTRKAPEHGACTTSPKPDKLVTSGSIAIASA
jgi:hypothetical protein